MAMRFWRSDRSHAVGTLERPARVVGLPTPQLKEWLDVEIMNLGSTYDQWRYHGIGGEEFTSRLEALSMMWDEVRERDE